MAMFTKASTQNTALLFNIQYNGSAEVVVNPYGVPGAFTKAGWAYMQNAISNSTEYASWEEWVLGPGAYLNVDRVQMQQRLQDRYRTDFVRAWRNFLFSTTVVPFDSLADSSRKLLKLAGNQSPLLSVLCEVSENTAVDARPVSNQFQVARQLVPTGCRNQLVGPSNAAYMDRLGKLQASVQAWVSDPASNSLRENVSMNCLEVFGQVVKLTYYPVNKKGGLQLPGLKPISSRVNSNSSIDLVTLVLLASPIQLVENLPLMAPALALKPGELSIQCNVATARLFIDGVEITPIDAGKDTNGTVKPGSWPSIVR
jgi:type VI protein secretion system component VasK